MGLSPGAAVIELWFLNNPTWSPSGQSVNLNQFSTLILSWLCVEHSTLNFDPESTLILRWKTVEMSKLIYLPKIKGESKLWKLTGFHSRLINFDSLLNQHLYLHTKVFLMVLVYKTELNLPVLAEVFACTIGTCFSTAFLIAVNFSMLKQLLHINSFSKADIDN